MFQRAFIDSVEVPAFSATERVSVVDRSSPWPLNHWEAPVAGAPSWVVTCLSGNGTTTPCAFAELYSCGPSFRVREVPAGTTS
jgi:hypothetical protein